jgi:hypothetical protein
MTFMSIYRCLAEEFRLALPIFVVLALAAVILVLPDQSKELYSLYFDPYKDLNLYVWTKPDQPTARSLLSVLESLISDSRLWCLVLSVAIFQIVIFASFHKLRSPNDHTAHSPSGNDATSPLLTHAPLQIAMVTPALILLLGMHAAWIQLARYPKKEFWLSEHLTYWFLVVLLLLSAGFATALHHANGRKHLVRTLFALYQLPHFAAICGVTLALVFLGHFGWEQFPQHVGSFGIVFIFLSALLYFATWLSWNCRKTRVPVLGALLVLVFAFAYLGLNDNHRIRYQISSHPLASLEEAFKAWYAARQDRTHYTQKGAKYPVYVVAAAGGGVYAALNTAEQLALMQDFCPAFAQHLFAISSVSGGSLGAAVITALAAKNAKNESWRECSFGPPRQRPYEGYVRAYFDYDFAAPLIWASLFPDFIQRVLP